MVVPVGLLLAILKDYDEAAGLQQACSVCGSGTKPALQVAMDGAAKAGVFLIKMESQLG